MEGATLKQANGAAVGRRRATGSFGGALLGAAGFGWLVCGLVLPAAASDYFQACRSADGQYVMEAEGLRELDPAAGDAHGRDLSYKVLARMPLARREGYCLSGKTQPRRYDHSAETYVLHVSLRAADGEIRRVFLICEEAGDGLPAAANCDKEVRTRDWVRQLPTDDGKAR